MMDRPDPVSRVAPPSTIITHSIAHTANSHPPPGAGSSRHGTSRSGAAEPSRSKGIVPLSIADHSATAARPAGRFCATFARVLRPAAVNRTRLPSCPSWFPFATRPLTLRPLHRRDRGGAGTDIARDRLRGRWQHRYGTATTGRPAGAVPAGRAPPPRLVRAERRHRDGRAGGERHLDRHAGRRRAERPGRHPRPARPRPGRGRAGADRRPPRHPAGHAQQARGLPPGERDPRPAARRCHAGHRMRAQGVPPRRVPGAAAFRPHAPLSAGAVHPGGRPRRVRAGQPPAADARAIQLRHAGPAVGRDLRPGGRVLAAAPLASARWWSTPDAAALELRRERVARRLAVVETGLVAGRLAAGRAWPCAAAGGAAHWTPRRRPARPRSCWWPPQPARWGCRGRSWPTPPGSGFGTWAGCLLAILAETGGVRGRLPLGAPGGPRLGGAAHPRPAGPAGRAAQPPSVRCDAHAAAAAGREQHPAEPAGGRVRRGDGRRSCWRRRSATCRRPWFSPCWAAASGWTVASSCCWPAALFVLASVLGLWLMQRTRTEAPQPGSQSGR